MKGKKMAYVAVTSTKERARRVTHENVADRIRDRISFKMNSLSGENFNAHGTGRLNEEWVKVWWDTKDIDFTVYSYATPIAWHTKAGEWVFVTQKFSSYTSRHQNIVRQAVNA